MKKALLPYRWDNLGTAHQYARLVAPSDRADNPARCPVCQADLVLVGTTSPVSVRTAHFRHPERNNLADPMEDCILADRTPRLARLAPDDWVTEDIARARRAAFLEPKALSLAFAFCKDMLVYGTYLPHGTFHTLFCRMDRQRVWSFSGIEPYMLPMVLLALGDFRPDPEVARDPRPFHFVFRPMPGWQARGLWQTPGCYRLQTVFANDKAGHPGFGSWVAVSETAYLKKAQSWKPDAIMMDRLRTLLVSGGRT